VSRSGCTSSVSRAIGVEETSVFAQCRPSAHLATNNATMRDRSEPPRSNADSKRSDVHTHPTCRLLPLVLCGPGRSRAYKQQSRTGREAWGPLAQGQPWHQERRRQRVRRPRANGTRHASPARAKRPRVRALRLRGSAPPSYAALALAPGRHDLTVRITPPRAPSLGQGVNAYERSSQPTRPRY
jgi:hypothetical protein